MHAIATFKHMMHEVHDDGLKIAHYAEHAVHEKRFWGMVALIALLVSLFAFLIMMSGNANYQDAPMSPFYAV